MHPKSGVSFLAVLLYALLSAHGASAALRVEEIVVAGARVARTDQVRWGAGIEMPPARTLRTGEVIGAGTRILVPAAVLLRLRSDNAVLITLYPQTDYAVDAVIPGGEVHAVYAGAARFSLTRLFDFFNVDLHAYVARVWGTEFEVETDSHGNVRVDLLRGTLACARDARARLDDRWVSTEVSDVLSEQGLRAVSYTPDAGDYLQRYDNYALAEARYGADLEIALARAGEAGGRDRVLAARNNLGQILLTLGRAESARAQFAAGEALARAAGDLPWQARMLNNLAAAGMLTRDYVEAEASARQALEINLRLHPHGVHKRIVHNLVNLAAAQRRLQRADDAATHLRRALDVAKVLDPEGQSAELAGVYEALGNLALERDGVGADDVIAWLERALAIRLRQADGRPHPDLAELYNSFGVAWRTLRDPAQALHWHRQALAQRQALFGARPHPKVADSWINIGNALYELGQYADARAGYEQALTIELALSSRGARLADTYTRLARVAQALGDSTMQAQYEAQARAARAP